MAAASFCNMGHGYGIKKVNQYLLKRQNIDRTYRESLLLEAVQRPFIPQMCFNKTKTRTLNITEAHDGTLSIYGADPTNAPLEEEKEENISKATLIWRAIKLPMYSVALILLAISILMHYNHRKRGRLFPYRPVFCRALFRPPVCSVLIVAWVNLSNDVYDFDTGADKNKKESVVNLSSSRTGTHGFALLLLALGFMGLTWVSMDAGSLRSILLFAYATICGYIYQCPPFRLSYLGLGEPLCFAAFGPFVTTGFYMVQTGTRSLSIPGTVVSSALLVGFTTSLILFCSHFHQIEDDKAVGKFPPLVRLGTEAGAKVVKVAVTTLYSLLFILGLSQALPFLSVVLCALTLPIGRLVVSFVEKNHKDKSKIVMAKCYCVRLHIVFGAALAAGLVGARQFIRKQLPNAIIV